MTIASVYIRELHNSTSSELDFGHFRLSLYYSIGRMRLPISVYGDLTRSLCRFCRRLPILPVSPSFTAGVATA